MTEAEIKKQAIQMVNKDKLMGYNLEEDHLDLYTSYFGGPKSSQHYRKTLEEEYKKRFVLGETITTKK